MLELRVLGAIDLRLSGQAADARLGSQAKRLALLTYLALARGPIRRDTLLALFWPEQSGERARHSLRQTVYALRRAAGGDFLVSQSDEELEVAPGKVSCDAVAFESLLDEGRREEALALYRGEFLEGLHPPDVAAEFEDWLTATRQRLRGLALQAVTALGAQAHAERNPTAALQWARRGTQLDPLNEGFQRDLITLLGAAGDRTGAQRAYESYSASLARDLDQGPSAPVRDALAGALAARGSPSAVPTVANASLITTTEPAEPPVRARRSHWRRGVAALGLLLVSVAAARLLTPRPYPTDARPILAVAAIRESGRSADSADAWPVTDLLATSLARLPIAQIVSNARLIEAEQALSRNGPAPTMREVAHRVGAGQLLEGTLVRLGEDSLVLELRRSDLRTGGILQSFRVGGRDIFVLVDRATAAIARGAGVAVPVEGIAEVTTGSAVALRLYQEGVRSFYANDMSAARRLFEAAVTEDSTFAMATWYLARVEGALALPGVIDRYRGAHRLARHASERERLLITAHVLWVSSAAAAPVVAETLATRYPGDRDALWVLGLARAGVDVPGGIRVLQRALLLDSMIPAAAGPQCTTCDLYATLVGLYVYADSLQRALEVARDFAARIPDSEVAWSLIQSLGMMLRDTAAAQRAEQELQRLRPDPRPVEIGTRVLQDLYDGNYLAADSALRTLGEFDPAIRPSVRWYQVISFLNQDRLREALALAQSEPRDRLLVALVDYERGRYRECAAFYQDHARSPTFVELGRKWPGAAAREVSWALARMAMCRAAAGDTADFMRLADSVQRVGALSSFGRDQRLHHYVRGLLWQARGDPARAVAEYRAAMTSPNMGFTRINYHLAQSLLRLNRPAEAIATLQSALRGALDASNLYLTRTAIHTLLGTAWDAAGNPDSARAHRARGRRAPA